MKRLLLVAVLGALVVGATGCDLSPPAATVNGVAISQSTLNAALSSESTDPAVQCATQLASSSSVSPVGVGTEGDGTTPNAVTPAAADNTLEALVLEQLELQSLAKRGVRVTPADVANAHTDYESQLANQLGQAQQQSSTPPGCALTTTKPIGGQLPGAFLDRQAASLAAQEKFEEAVGHVDLSEAALQSYYRTNLAQFTQLCLNLIVADTQAAAQTLHDQIAAGASFATASASSAADQQQSPTDGALPCEYPAQASSQLGATLFATVNALSSGQLGQPYPFPAQSSTGTSTTFYLVIQMRQHQVVPLAPLRSSIRQAILSAHVSVVGTTLTKLVGQAQVSIDSRYGSWSAKKGVNLPTPPPPAFVPNAKVNVPPVLPTPGLHLSIPPS